MQQHTNSDKHKAVLVTWMSLNISDYIYSAKGLGTLVKMSVTMNR